MLQRMQSIWLLLAGLCSFLTVKFNVYTGQRDVDGGMNAFSEINAASHFLILAFTIATGLIALITIFQYKNRPLQIKMCFVGLLSFILTCVFYYLEIKKFTVGSFSLLSVFLFLVPIFYLLAIRGIWRDQKLIKSVDRLR